MTAQLLFGAPVADALKQAGKTRVERLALKGVIPQLAAILVGSRPEDVAYERSLVKAAANLGIAFDARTCPEDVSQEVLARIVGEANADPDVDGCMIFRPLPASIDEMALCNALAAAKDVDGVSASSLAGVFMNEPEGFAPATAEACVRLLDHYGIELAGRHVVVVGRSLVVGKPVGMLMLARDATVSYCHSRTADLPALTRAADIVVCAVGRPRFFGAQHFSEGQVVLDVGVNDDGNGGLCGDVDFEAASRIVDAVTPVPGGLGAVSTAVLLKHVVDAAERRL